MVHVLVALAPWRAALDVWPTVNKGRSLGDDAEVRHHCYLLHIGMRHLSFHAWTGNEGELRAVASWIGGLLDVGPSGDEQLRARWPVPSDGER